MIFKIPQETIVSKYILFNKCLISFKKNILPAVLFIPNVQLKILDSELFKPLVITRFNSPVSF